MKPAVITIISAFAFAALGVMAAFGIAMYAPTPPTERPDFERTMFILLPLAGSVIGWLTAYFALPYRHPAGVSRSSVRLADEPRRDTA